MTDAKVAELEARIKELEVENAKKDEIIKRLSGGASGAAAPAAPPKPGPTPDEAAELLCYDDDAALGVKCPSLAGLTFVKDGPIEVGKGKAVVITFFCNLNKGDFVTMTVLSDIYQKYKDAVDFVAVSRDHELADAEKWNKKYNGTHMAEQKNPDGTPGVDVRCDFALAFDPEHQFNTALKQAMKKATIGVGFCVLVDKEGTIRWYESFIRGANPAGQFEYQLYAVINGVPLISNGNAPEVVEEEVDGDEGVIPDDIDAFGGGGGNY